MTDQVMDWDDAYQEKVFQAPPPWNIGEPQPDLAALIAAGQVRGEVLDAGCGVAELSLALAAAGYTVVGIDNSPTAIAEATRTAKQRGLTTATFVVDDITKFSGYEGRFGTVIDSTLFHSLPVEDRANYLQAVHRAAAPGASYYVLAFAKGAFPADARYRPNKVDEQELRSAVGEYWEIDDVRPAAIHGNMPQVPDMPEVPDMPPPPYPVDDKGRVMMPAYLLTAHKVDQ